VTLAEPAVTELVQFERSDSDYVVHCSHIAPIERPPIVSLPEYRARIAG
jgi:hypothetical protein